MHINQLQQLQGDIQCGKFECLKNCCSEDKLREIYFLMRSIGETDIPRLHMLLCGCAVPGSTVNQSASNCTDTIVKYVCGSKGTLTAVATVLAGVSVALPHLAIVTAPLALFIKDLIDGCNVQGGSRLDAAMDKLCGFDAWAQSLVSRNLPAALAEIVNTMLQWVSPIRGTILQCCSQRRVSNSWPEIGELPTGSGNGSNPSVTLPSDAERPTVTTPVSNETGTGTGMNSTVKPYKPVVVTVPITPDTIVYPGRMY